MYTRVAGSARLCLAASCCLLAVSCTGGDQIQSYTIEPVAQRDTPTPEPEQAPGMAWFFKLVGPADQVAGRVAEVDTFLQSVRFGADGDPDWDRPQGWTEQSGNEIRFATLVIPGTEPPLEVSVTALPASDPGSDAYLRANVDRWRRQLGLSAYTQQDWRNEAEAAGELADLTADGVGVLRVNLLGSNEEFPEARMLAAVVWKSAGASDTSPGDSPDEPPLTYEAPDGWTLAAPRAFQIALFTIGTGDDAGEASISSAGGSLDMNVNRWRGQVGLSPVAGSELTESLEEIEVGGRSAQRVQIDGSEQSIRAVVVPDGRSNWFFKLNGPAALVAQESDRFDEFVESVQFAD